MTDATKAPSEPAVTSKDSLRAAIFTTRKPAKKVIDFFGVNIELRQPILEDILQAANTEGNSNQAVIDQLVKYAYVPDTDILIFDEADADQFKVMPFGKEFVAVIDALQELTGVNFPNKKAS